MGKITLTHEINCDEPTFWKIFFDKTYNEVLYRQGLGFPKYDIVEQREDDKTIFRKVSGTPKMDVPAPVAKALGGSFSYVEEGTFDKATKSFKWKMIPSAMRDKLRNEGTVRIESVGAGKVRRIAEIVMEAKVMLIGGLLESSAEKNFRDGWDRSAAFTNKWIAEGKAG
jgi:hypothetical protein